MPDSSHQPPHSGLRSAIRLMIDLRLAYAVVSTGLILVGFFWNNLEGFGLRYVTLIVGIFFANVFMFVVNDFYDAPHDFEDPSKRTRNLFCSADTEKLGKRVLYASLGLSILLGAIISLQTLVIIALLNFLAFSYSAPPIKLRNRMGWDWIFVFIWKGLIIAASFIYFFGQDLSAFNSFMVGSLVVVMLYSLIAQMDNQIRDFHVDRTTNSNHSVQRLGHEYSSVLRRILLVLFFGISLIFCYLMHLYITVMLILLNSSLFFIVNPRKHNDVLEFCTIWVVVLFMEHFSSSFSLAQQLLFSVWVVTMGGIALIHMKRIDLFADRAGA